MSRLLFFLLLVANLAFGAHLWLTAKPAEPDFSRRERNRDEAKVVAVISHIWFSASVTVSHSPVDRMAGSKARPATTPIW